MELKIWENKQNKKINSELYSKHAEEWAKAIKDSTKDKNKNKNKITQIRRFYDELLTYEDYLKNGEKYEDLIPYIKMLNAKAAYAEGRKLITSEFRNMLSQMLKEIDEKNTDTFKIIKTFFEAFLGFYKFYDETNN